LTTAKDLNKEVKTNVMKSKDKNLLSESSLRQRKLRIWKFNAHHKLEPLAQK